MDNASSDKSLISFITAQGESASEHLRALGARLQGYRDGCIARKAIDILHPRMPAFLYFSSYDRMSGRVRLEKLAQDKANKTVTSADQVFLDFLEFAGTTTEKLQSVRRFEDLKARVEAASIKITRQIFEYWSQNRHLKVEFSVESGRPDDPAPFNEGNVMHARIRNQLHDMTVPFDDRSAGFTWFFSFLVKFSQVKKHHGSLIILLDEPGRARPESPRQSPGRPIAVYP